MLDDVKNGEPIDVDNLATFGLHLRRYKMSDIPEIVEATHLFCSEHPFYSKLPFSKEKLGSVLEHNLDNKRMFCEIVWLNDERIAGMAGMTSGYAMADEFFTQDIFHFVKHEHRGSPAFPMLIGAYIMWAQSLGAFNATLSYTGEKAEALTRILKRWGFEHFGDLYTKTLT